MNRFSLSSGDLVLIKKIPIWHSISNEPRYTPRTTNEFDHMKGRIYEVGSILTFKDRFPVKEAGQHQKILFPYDSEYVEVVFTL